MELKRKMTMTWDGLGHHDDEDDDFFDTTNRISAVIPMDVLMGHCDDSSDDDEFEDPRMSFASVVSSEGGPHRMSNVCGPTPPLTPRLSSSEEYGIWMEAPSSIEERRRRLLHGMGMNSSRELLKLRTMALSKKLSIVEDRGLRSSETTSSLPKNDDEAGVNGEIIHDNDNSTTGSPSPYASFVLVRSRSDGDIDAFSMEMKKRKELLLGNVSKQRLTRTLSNIVPFSRVCNSNYNDVNSGTTSGASSSERRNHDQIEGGKESNDDENKNKSNKTAKKGRPNNKKSGLMSNVGEQIGAFFLIKNLDTGKEFVVKEFAEDGMWNRLSDLETGKQLTMEEFEKSVGYSPVVKELMRRQNQGQHSSVDGSAVVALDRKSSVNSYLSKSFRNSKRRGFSFLKNINKVANSVTGLGGTTPEREPHHPVSQPSIPSQNSNPPEGQKNNLTQSNEWVRVRTQGKTCKELTALRFCQEIPAHQGSIWTIKFNHDGRYLASAGEDKVIHIWEVQECEVAALRPPEELVNATPLHPMFCPSPERDKSPLAPDMSTLDKKKKGRLGSRRGSGMPDYIQLPETVFGLSTEPICTFEGHLDDVLDLSWSRSQLYLLSSSMDKTVRLWDLETKTCLKLFAHNDYVTCIQFNPVNDRYFISGSLDAKVRIWSIPGRRVVDWTDLHEMVTAACFTPDGQGAAVGSHKGNCRMYNIAGGKLNQTLQFDVQTKKKTVSKKITGFEFSSDNPNEVLVTSADSRVRIYDGSEVIQKFRGFRNTSSQIAASFSPDGKYVICGSEDSHVYVWKKEEPRNGKTRTMIDTRSYEYFQCKDVSVAIPWPGGMKFDAPTIQLNPKKHPKKPSTSASNSPKKEDVNKNAKKHLPPLPNKKNTNVTDKTVTKENKDHNSNNSSSENHASSNNIKDDDNNTNNTTSTNNNEVNEDGEKAPDSPEADPAHIGRTDSGMGDSFSSTTGESLRYGDSPSLSSNHSPSPSWASGWSWFDGGASHGGDTMQARAWGLVIVTAGLGGEIKAYQNIGLPLKVGRQSNIFLA